MTYAEIKRHTLELANMYSIAGDPVPSSYNNQQDYLNRIPGLINSALVNIRTLVKRDPVLFTLEEGEPVGNMMRYALPADFYCLKSGGASVLRDGKFLNSNEYKLQGRRYILIPDYAPREYTVEYYQYPPQLPVDPDDDYELDEDLEVLQAAEVYAAAYLVLPDDQYMYTVLYNDYETRMGRIMPGVTVEVHPVEDAYRFNGDWGFMA